ncbi:MAG: dicarboxylate/amino acid:cation symporter, partial [Thermomicrobium sp.]|nr:dicarboxylate/amino acid:cation symporter [Thermomicrobium sp.]
MGDASTDLGAGDQEQPLDPGEGRGLELPSYAAPAAPSVREVLVGLIPRNPVQAMAEGNML